jgi:predicted AAA+ superfamily ATPase
MWIKRDFEHYLTDLKGSPIKILKGPRQVGKTSLLSHCGVGQAVFFDDAATRRIASDDPRGFLDQLPSELLLDEATLVPELFLEIKRRVDAARRTGSALPNYWITGSNQTLLQRAVRESLAGRASYFDLNTLSIHELGNWRPAKHLLRGGWPELNIGNDLPFASYLNDLILTFIEKDIVAAAGIEKRSAFSKALSLVSGRVGELFNASDIARDCGVDVTTIQSWVSLLQQNGVLLEVQPYFSNFNKRLIKSSKLYFEDVSLATRLQGWASFEPLMVSPAFGHLIENVAVSEISRFFTNRGERPKLHFLRSKEKVEIDLLISFANQRTIAAEIKSTALPFSKEQNRLLESVDLNIMERWVIASTTTEVQIPETRVVAFDQIWNELNRVAGD